MLPRHADQGRIAKEKRQATGPKKRAGDSVVIPPSEALNGAVELSIDNRVTEHEGHFAQGFSVLRS